MERLSHVQAIAVIVCVLGLAESGCKREQASEGVVVYCSVDEAFARDVLDRYEQKSGTQVRAVFDSEAGKTTGLVRRIEQEAGRPRADVFWSSEVFNTILLARAGLLETFDPPAASDIPSRYKDPEHRWTALAVRGRVIAFDPARTGKESIPTRWEDLASPDFAPHVAIANPLFGTTRGHVAAMFALWGEERGRAFLTGLREHGAAVADGNSATVRTVMAGKAALAATDTDDVWVAQRSGAKIDLRYPDMGDGGTLFIPCSVAIVKGGPNTQAAHGLVDFLVSAEVERMLAQSASRNIPVREALRRELDLDMPPASKVTYDAVADAMPTAADAIREILVR